MTPQPPPGRSPDGQPGQPGPSSSDLIDELTDSLTLQRTILASLEDQSFSSEDFESEKTQARAEIVRLQKELAEGPYLSLHTVACILEYH